MNFFNIFLRNSIDKIRQRWYNGKGDYFEVVMVKVRAHCFPLRCGCIYLCHHALVWNLLPDQISVWRFLPRLRNDTRVSARSAVGFQRSVLLPSVMGHYPANRNFTVSVPTQKERDCVLHYACDLLRTDVRRLFLPNALLATANRCVRPGK